MDSSMIVKLVKSSIHPLAEKLLFEHKRVVSRIFRDVIGLYQLAHFSITLINRQNEMVFLSYTPSIEYNLITSGLWSSDLSYHPNFYLNQAAKLWHELYLPHEYDGLLQIKQVQTGLSMGIAIPVQHEHFSLVYSCATASKDPNIAMELYQQQEALKDVGSYCFQKLSPLLTSLSLPALIPSQSEDKIPLPYIKLVVKN